MKKKNGILIHPAAEAELESIYKFIAPDSRANALRFLKGLKKAVSSIRAFPRKGRLIGGVEKFAGREIRGLPYRSYLIIYDISKDGLITVLHIAGPGQDWEDFSF